MIILPESKGNDRQIISFQTEHRDADQDTEYRRCKNTYKKRQQEPDNINM